MKIRIPIAGHALVSWFFTTALALTGIFWAYKLGYLNTLVQYDVTRLTIIIPIIGLLTSLYIGYLSHWLDQEDDFTKEMNKPYETIWQIYQNLPYLGYLGTIIGLANMLQHSVQANISTQNVDTSFILKMMYEMGVASGTALFPTFVALCFYLFLKGQLFIFDRNRGDIWEGD